MANIHTGEVRPWDSLTKEQQESGEWIKVPDGTEGGMARPVTLLDRMFPKPTAADEERALRRAFNARHDQLRGFDATGKPRQ
jgi:hypothetical protein